MKNRLTADKRRWTQIFSSANHKSRITNRIFYLCLSVFICGLIFFCLKNPDSSKVFAKNSQSEIEKAIFTRTEFFGAEAIVPLPTNRARENLSKLLENQPDNPQILGKIAEFSEKLERYDESENNLRRLSEIEPSKIETLIQFYHRRASFEKEAETLKNLLFAENAQNRAVFFERLINLARIHDLQEYLQPAFYEQVIQKKPNVFGVFQKISEKLVEEKNYGEALKFIRSAKAKFPAQKSFWLDKEIEILLAIREAKEAEAVYQAAFDPFWSEDEAQKFYDFLSNQDRLREYGAELKAKFKKNPADFEIGIRLALYQDHDYIYSNDDIAPIITKIERAKKDWTTDELVTATRLLLQKSEGEMASRFLYTLYLREDFQKNPTQRAKILYQLFKMFSEAGSEKLPLTKGDLSFYEDVAKADTNPGIATGILSLIFSDTNPRSKLEDQEIQANKFFNCAAAYRIFEEYKKDSPVSDELAQMYLDIVKIYTESKEPEIAEQTLNEFAARYENSDDYPTAAVKLAEAFSAVKNEEKARETYQKILDYIGKQDKPLSPQRISSDEETAINKTTSIYNSYTTPRYSDYLARQKSSITYKDTLSRIVASLARDNKTPEILALYSGEIAKYPAEEWLYADRLSWLEQTNLTDEKLESYKTALARFQTNDWRDKLARFFVRENRNAEFTEFSTDLVSKLNDKEIENYLAQFIDKDVSAKDFKRALYLKLYQSAHERFPHNMKFVGGLLSFYKTNKQEAEWRKLSAEYYFESKEIRESFLNDLAEKAKLRNYLQTSQDKQDTIYKLFRADASARLSDYENSVAAYRELDRLYPHTPEFSERLIAFTRSFGQKNSEMLAEASEISASQANYVLSSAEYRTRSGEIYAELGDYEKSREEWEKLIATARGNREIYLDTATVYWDYFQYDDALRAIQNLRRKFEDETLYTFEAGAILESQNKKSEAIGEYVKAFDANRDESQKERSQKRLAKLLANRDSAAKKQEILQTIDAAYSRERAKRKDASFLALGYAEFLAQTTQPEKVETVLSQTIVQHKDTEFLTAARDFCQSENIERGEQNVLKRLAEISSSARQKMKYRFQLAESYEENQNRDAAKTVLDALVQEFPTNYGVLTESVNFYKRLGFETQAVDVLKTALPKSRGDYQTALAQKLAKLLIPLNQLDSAERILTKLHTENKTDSEIFHELAAICIRTGNAELLRSSFNQTVEALRQTKIERRELDDKIADLRVSMIDAFTRLKDYRSAVEQHIEIINREPENEQLTENAIRYVRRYGSADVLLDYYRKLSTEAFKNYRWNVVLARIYEANNDTQNALVNYQTAIVNQPEMVELYSAIAEIETKRGNFDSALKNLDMILELTNDEAIYVKKKIEILKKAGRTAEIAAEEAKLPIEAKIPQNDFAEAKNSANAEKAREIYRQAFAKLLENPLRESLNAADISGYVQSVRKEESLDSINKRLWNLREKLVRIANENDSTDAGEARKKLSILDGAIIVSIGNIAKNFGTDQELATLHEDFKNRIEQYYSPNDLHQSISLIQNVSVRAGFGDLEELILQKKLEANKNSLDRKIHLQNLINFYNERGAYQKTFDILEKYTSDDLPLKAETARLVGNHEKELETLRSIYRADFHKLSATNDENISRFLEILYAENRDELQSLTEINSAFRLQLINFLLAKGERKLVHETIENSDFSVAWKLARHAETSLALRESGETADCYFCDALQLSTIGEMINQSPDKQKVLINDDWFRLTREYGEWLEKTNEKTVSPAKFLTAGIENLPRDPQEQIKLGTYYLNKKDYENAVAHLRLAAELSDRNNELQAILGAAYYLAGRKAEAENTWTDLFKELPDDQQTEISLLIAQTLHRYDLVTQIRVPLSQIVVKYLENNDADNSPEFQKLIRIIADSFGDEAEKATYFNQILTNRPTDKSLAEMLIDENLIGENQRSQFYKLLIERNREIDYRDYSFQAVQQRIFDYAEAELIYDQETDYAPEEPDYERLTWQKRFVEFLLQKRETAEANRLITEIETDLKTIYARPLWLRTAKITLQIRTGNYDSAEAEKIIGITVPESATEIKPPSLERFNEIVRILKDEKQDAEIAKLSERFFARNLALERFDIANYAGLARIYFQKNETEKALRMLNLMVDAGVSGKKETALAETLSFEIVKAKSPDAAKTAEISQESNISQNEALKISAELSAEFNQIDLAIRFRQTLLSVNPGDDANKIELANLLSSNDRQNEAVEILRGIVGDRNALRSMRWQARMNLREMGQNIEFPSFSFDSFSQFYGGILQSKSNHFETANDSFINSLIADKDAPISVRQELIKNYALVGKPYAALKFAENYKETKSDELFQILSESAEKTGDFQKAIMFEKAKTTGGNAERIANLQKRLDDKNKRATDFTVDEANTRKL